MKKKLLSIALCALLALGCFALAGCAGGSSDTTSASSDGSSAGGASGSISVYSREDGSGTRGAFVELFGIEQEDASGEAVDMTTSSAAITNSTSVMMTSVAGDINAIGYISLGSLNDTVHAVTINGVEASAENVKSGDYEISRPFNIATKDGLSDQAQDFMTFIMSAEGQAVVEEEGYITVDEAAPAYEQAEGLSGRITVAGSSSVTPVMEKLAEAYQALNPDVTIEVNQSDSTTGMNMAAEGTCDIGMASRAVKDSEIAQGLTSTTIALDGIAVIVNNDAGIEDLTTDQVMQIYVGEVTDWKDVLA